MSGISAPSVPNNAFTVPGQVVLSDLVYSIQLHRTGNRQSPPIINLDSNQKLRLSFDMLEFDSRQLRVSFTHHNPDWSRSNLAQEFYQDGFFNLNLNSGRVSQGQRPAFRTYQYDFPNDNVQFLVSGNYMLRVEDADTGNLVFTKPFFVTENEGEIISTVDTILVPRTDLRTSHYPVSRYQLPDFVDQPQFDLEFYYVQNQFWGRSRKANELDTSNEFEVQFEMRQEHPFNGSYEFQFLPLSNLSQRANAILEYDPATIPPRVVLFDDAQGFSASPNRIAGNRSGNPSQSMSAQYANVFFRFDPAQNYPESTDIYVVGDFNNWSIRSDYALEYRADIDRWETNGIIKEGTYSYKYVIIENNRINDLALDDSFTRTEQEYHAFVYMRDHNRFYYRLLQINQFFARS